MKMIKDRLKETMVKALRLETTPESLPEVNLVSELGIDSVDSLELLIWVENEFGIQIADEDLSVNLVDSLDTLAQYVSQRLQQPATMEKEL